MEQEIERVTGSDRIGRLLSLTRPPPLGYVIAVLTVGLALLFKLLLDPLIEEETPFLLFLSAVMVSAWFGGFRSGLLATALAAFAADYFFLYPTYSLWLDNFGQALRLVLFVLEGTFISLLMGMIVSAWRHAETKTLQSQKDQEDLSRSEERFHSLVLNASDIIMVLDRDGTISYESPAVERVLGYKPEDRIGTSIFAHIHPGDVGHVRRALIESTDVPGVYPSVEYRVRDEEGRWRSFEAIGNNLLDDPAVRGIVVNSRDITDRKLAEERLRAGEERYRSLVTATSQTVWIANPLGELVALNNWDELTGQLPDDFRNWEWINALHPDDREPTRAAWAHALATKTFYEIEHRVLGPDGTYRHLLARATPILKSDGEVREWVGVSYDITERKQAEEELRRAEEKYRGIFENSIDGIFQTSRDGRIETANPAMARILGYESPEELIASISDVARQLYADPDRREELDRLVRREDAVSDFETRVYRKDGGVIWVSANLRAMRDGEGNLVGFEGTLEDVTERKRAEDALRHSEERYRAVVEQSTEGIYLVEVDTMRILEANRSCRKILGYASEELRGMELYDILAHSREDVDSSLQHTLRDGNRSVGERKYRRKDGTSVDVEVGASTISYGGREAVCVTVHDLTERKEAEGALREALEAERRRIARDLHDVVLSDLVYSLQETQIAHLTVARKDENIGSLQESLEVIAETLRRSVEGLRSAIFELRLQENLEKSIITSLESLVEVNRRMARKRYEVGLIVEEGFPESFPPATARSIVRIVQEALNNARRHSRARNVRVTLRTRGGDVCVEVADDGRGFDVAGARGGVGSSSMRERALDLGGELTVESEPGAGTLVRFCAPAIRLLRG